VPVRGERVVGQAEHAALADLLALLGVDVVLVGGDLLALAAAVGGAAAAAGPRVLAARRQRGHRDGQSRRPKDGTPRHTHMNLLRSRSSRSSSPLDALSRQMWSALTTVVAPFSPV